MCVTKPVISLSQVCFTNNSDGPVFEYVEEAEHHPKG